MIPDINLLPFKNRQSKKISIVIYMIIVIWVILMGLILFQYHQTRENVASMQTRTNSLKLEKTALETQLNNQQKVPTHHFSEAVDYAEKLTAPTSIIIDELVKVLPDYSYLTDYSYTDGQVTIQTQFESLDRVAGYVTNLEESNIFSDVKVDNIDTFQIEQTTEASGEVRIDETKDAVFDELPRYDVSLSLQINMPALLNDTGGEEENE